MSEITGRHRIKKASLTATVRYKSWTNRPEPVTCNREVTWFSTGSWSHGDKPISLLNRRSEYIRLHVHYTLNRTPAFNSGSRVRISGPDILIDAVAPAFPAVIVLNRPWPCPFIIYIHNFGRYTYILKINTVVIFWFYTFEFEELWFKYTAEVKKI